MVKVSKKLHIRKVGAGKLKLRRNPKARRVSYMGITPDFGRVIETIHLENHSYDEIQHHKFYIIKLIQGPSGFYVFTNWGKVGATVEGQSKTLGPYSAYVARDEMGRIADSKRRGGYF